MSMPSMRRVFSKRNFQVSSRPNSGRHLARVFCFGHDFWNLPPKLPYQLHEKWHSLSLFTAKTFHLVLVSWRTSPQHVKAYGFRPHEIAQLFVAGFGSAMISSCCLEKLELFVACLDILGYVQDTKQQHTTTNPKANQNKTNPKKTPPTN